VTADPPKSFVGIYIADPGDEGLIEQTPLNGGPACAQPSRYLVSVEALLKWIGSDMGHRTGDTVKERGQGQSAEGALVEEAQVTTFVEGDDNAGMAMLRGMTVNDTEMTAHAQMSQ